MNELAACNSGTSRYRDCYYLFTKLSCFTHFTVSQKQVECDVMCNGLGLIDLLHLDMLHCWHV
jgi:hypothetical protein